MIRLTRRLDAPAAADATLTLPLAGRAKRRWRVTLDDGTPGGLFLDRGGPLRDGDLIGDEQGFVVRVRAAPEEVSTARCEDPLLLARACYHLGNRHVPLQIDRDWVRYAPDHVLDAMLRGLGLSVESEQVPFEPEPGAYGGAPHGHGD
jgi:urease accessory protein